MASNLVSKLYSTSVYQMFNIFVFISFYIHLTIFYLFLAQYISGFASPMVRAEGAVNLYISSLH